jgi:hypothetical protein
VANPRAADRPTGGWPPEGRIGMTPQRLPNYFPLTVCLIMAAHLQEEARARAEGPLLAGGRQSQEEHRLERLRPRPARPRPVQSHRNRLALGTKAVPRTRR